MCEYHSSVLRCDVGDDECHVCRFLSGDRDIEILVKVIATLDRACGEAEKDRNHYMKCVMNQVNRSN